MSASPDTDAAPGQRRTLLDLIRTNRGQVLIGGAMHEGALGLGTARRRWLHRRGPEETTDDAGRRQVLEKWLSRVFPVSENSTAGRHLHNRGLDPFDAAGLRFHPRTMVCFDDHVSQAPALLAPVRDPEGRLEAVHRIYMTPRGGRPDIGGHKRTSGGPGEGTVTLGARNPCGLCPPRASKARWRYGRCLISGERADTAVMASISANRIASVAAPDTIREIVLVQYRDQADEQAWADLRRSWDGSGINIRRILLIGKDASEDLLEYGRDGDIRAPGATDIAWRAVRGTRPKANCPTRRGSRCCGCADPVPRGAQGRRPRRLSGRGDPSGNPAGPDAVSEREGNWQI